MDRVKELRRKAIIRRVIVTLSIAIPFALIGSGIYCLASFDRFRVENVSVSGNIAVNGADITSFLYNKADRSFFGKILGNDHILAWDSISPKRITEEFLRVKEARITREDRNVLISIKEKKEFLIWCYGQEGGEISCVWTDDKGWSFSEAPDSEGSLIRVIYDRSGDKPYLGSDVIPRKEFDNIVRFLNIVSGLDVFSREISISGEEKRDIVLKIDSGQEIYFDSSIDPDSFVPPVLSSLISSGEWPSISYVDLRIEGKGFYRLR